MNYKEFMEWFMLKPIFGLLRTTNNNFIGTIDSMITGF